MAFKLLIECSKDIQFLQINFSDGTSVVTSKEPEKNKEPKENKTEKIQKENREIKEPILPKAPKRKNLEEYLDTDTDFSINQEVIEKPVIQDLIRPPKVTDELQNLDF